ncbi:MAG: thiamine phosphate synthase [Candidatus Sulfotelmatobacter sp.]
MAESPLLYYITDRTALAPDEPARRRRLLEKIAQGARANVDYIQLREKDLSTRELESLASEAMRMITKLRTGNRELRTRLLINSRADIALAVQADGVHLRSNDVSPGEARTMWRCSRVGTAALGFPAARSAPTAGDEARAFQQEPLIGISCHTPEEVAATRNSGATFAVFAPVFEKKDAPGAPPAGLAQLREACKVDIPVLALGGITLANAHSCLEAGAAGLAAIRLFQEHDIAEVAARLRNL